MTPQLSIIITTYNRPEFLSEAAQSVIEQDCSYWELIIVDDGSMKPAQEVLTAPSGVQRIYHYRNPKSRGVSAARNLGVAKASAPLVAFLDDDDRLYPRFARTMTSVFQQKGHAIHFAWPILRHFGAVQTSRRSQNQHCFIAEGRGTSASFRAIQGVKGTGAVFRRDAFLAAGGFDEDLQVSEDRDLMFRMLTMGYGCTRVGEELVQFRAHSAPRLSNAGLQRQIATDQILAERHLAFLKQNPALAAHFLNMLARRQYLAGDVNGALATLRQSMALKPLSPKVWRRIIHWFLVGKWLSYSNPAAPRK